VGNEPLTRRWNYTSHSLNTILISGSHTFANYVGTSGAMDRSIHTAATHEGRVRCIHDSLCILFDNISLKQGKLRVAIFKRKQKDALYFQVSVTISHSSSLARASLPYPKNIASRVLEGRNGEIALRVRSFH
jgi:hypothetical protein